MLLSGDGFNYVRTHIGGTIIFGMGNIAYEVKAIDRVTACFLSAMSLLEADYINLVLECKDFDKALLGCRSVLNV